MDTARISAALRAQVVEMSHVSRAAHLASALSCIDLIAVLYHSILQLIPGKPNAPERDRFILSKGHAASALYAALAFKGLIHESDMLGYGQKGSYLEEHPSTKLPGVEAATGSLGHGLPIGCGMSLAGRIQGIPYRTFVLMGDGECNEGSVWEAAMFASRYCLDSLTAMVDYNKWQATGRSHEILQLKPLAEKWRSFGWEVAEIDGHDHLQIYDALNSETKGGKPKMIMAHTVKGKGVSFMEDDNNWHYRIPTTEQVRAAKMELGMP